MAMTFRLYFLLVGLALVASVGLRPVAVAAQDDAPSAEQPSTENDPQEEKSDEPAEAPNEEGTEKPDEPNSEAPSSDKGDDEDPADDQPADDKKPVELPDSIAFEEFVVLPSVGTYGRAAVHIDPVEAALADGTWKTPKSGDSVESTGGRITKWRADEAEKGILRAQSIAGGGYAVTTVESPADGVMILRAAGHASVYVNGNLHAGDVYMLGGFDLPVELKKGKNEFVFHVYQNELHAELVRPAGRVELATEAAVTPTLVSGTKGRVWIGLPMIHAGTEPLKNGRIVAQTVAGDAVETALPWIDAATFHNASIEVAVPEGYSDQSLAVDLKLVAGSETLAEDQLTLEVVQAKELQVRTFRSAIDRSVQSYVVRPAAEPSEETDGNLVSQEGDGSEPKAAIVALHSIGSSALEFAGNYEPKPWAHLIAPSGRGRYNFDWEDWAQTDAREALADAKKHFSIDAERIYLTGHEAGGHAAWFWAASEPGRFAAVATTAGWTSLWHYGGGLPQYGDPSPPQDVLLRSTDLSDLPQRVMNLRGTGMYLLHGSEDERVKITESRRMATLLAASHNDFVFREKMGEGNWWGGATVDSEEMLDFLRERTRQKDLDEKVDFATANVGENATCRWATIAGQEQPFATSEIHLALEDKPLSITGTTSNVTRLKIDKSALPTNRPFQIRLDGGRPIAFRSMPRSGAVWIEKQGDTWRRARTPSKKEKGPHRYGGFKALFDNNVLLVYGTQGSKEENAWSRAKAHFDAESFYYRGAGSLDVVADSEFDATKEKDRNVVLYGNVRTNSAWPALLSLSPVQIDKGQIQVGLRPESGSDLGILMVRPRPGSDTALVGVVGGTGIKGMRLTSRMRYFMAGVAYPDLVIFGPDTLREGDADVRAAGFFSDKWEVEEDDIAWRDLAL